MHNMHVKHFAGPKIYCVFCLSFLYMGLNSYKTTSEAIVLHLRHKTQVLHYGHVSHVEGNQQFRQAHELLGTAVSLLQFTLSFLCNRQAEI